MDKCWSMKNNILVLAEPRTGSGLLCRLISSDTDTKMIGEFFSGGRMSIVFHLLTFAKYVKHRNTSGIKHYQSMSYYLSQAESFDVFHDAKNFLSVETLEELIQFEDRSLCLKLFDNHIEKQKLDIEKLLSLFNYVIFLYRFDVLNTFISWKRAYETNMWSSLTKGWEKRRSYKIEWDLQGYKDFYERYTRRYKNILNIFKRCDNKQKAVICYEDLERCENKYEYVQKILQDSGINKNLMPTPDDPLYKQALPVSLEENFTNKKDFLRDYHLIEGISFYEPDLGF
jgi:LPS sulfotransferase NodH